MMNTAWVTSSARCALSKMRSAVEWTSERYRLTSSPNASSELLAAYSANNSASSMLTTTYHTNKSPPNGKGDKVFVRLNALQFEVRDYYFESTHHRNRARQDALRPIYEDDNTILRS